MNEIIPGFLVSLVILPTVFSTHQRLTRSVNLNRETEYFLVENTIKSINIKKILYRGHIVYEDERWPSAPDSSPRQ